MTPDEVTATTLQMTLLAEYDQARKARASWEVQEKEIKAAILDTLGYDADDPKPVPTIVNRPDGTELFKVTRGTWRGLNQKYLKEHHPDVYAECEASKSTLAIKYDPLR